MIEISMMNALESIFYIGRQKAKDYDSSDCRARIYLYCKFHNNTDARRM